MEDGFEPREAKEGANVIGEPQTDTWEMLGTVAAKLAGVGRGSEEDEGDAGPALPMRRKLAGPTRASVGHDARSGMEKAPAARAGAVDETSFRTTDAGELAKIKRLIEASKGRCR